MPLISLLAFTETTRDIAVADGFVDYCPTLCDEEEVIVIEGIPDHVDHREAVQHMAQRRGFLDKEFLFGVLSGEDEITTGHITPDGASFMAVRLIHGQVRLCEEPRPAWWTFRI